MPSAANAEDGVRPKHDEAGGLQLKTLITPLVLAAAVGLAITVTWFSSSEPMSPVGEVVQSLAIIVVVFGVAALLFQHVQAGRRATADQLAATETELEDARHRVTLLEEQLSTQPTRTRRGAELLAELQRWCAEDDAAIEDVRQLVIDSTRVAYEQQRCPGTEAAFHLVTDAESADDTG